MIIQSMTRQTDERIKTLIFYFVISTHIGSSCLLDVNNKLRFICVPLKNCALENLYEYF